MLENVISQFDLKGDVRSLKAYGNGHINWTYEVYMTDGRKFLLQQVNTFVFKDPVGLMRNIELLTDFLRKKNSDPRAVLHLNPTYDGKTYTVDEEGRYWRVYDFVENCTCYDEAPSLDLFTESGATFGKFQNDLADFPVEQLVETIPNFHNTPSRYKDFDKVIAEDPKGRLSTVRDDVAFLLDRREFGSFLMDKLNAGVIPLRVTHNDTKINNVLFDAATNKGLCVIDLDTTMPGLPVYDFGDSIRYAANSAKEDEIDTGKVSLMIDHFESFAEGFVGTCKKNLSYEELAICPEGAVMMTLENGLRFLKDYLEGDVYYHIAYPEHNLVRARTQFALVADMERKMGKMHDIVDRILES